MKSSSGQFRLLGLIITGACLTLLGGCQKPMPPENFDTPLRDINAVLADHDERLLALPGVVGVYVGLLDDQQTQCLKVMLARPDPALERSLPPTLEGHPLVTEVTGEIKPLQP